MTDLPIRAVLPKLLAALRDQPNAVLVAPPGAGKTTAVAPALLAEPWCSGEILLLSPRRLAARAAAERMAELAGEKVGETIGYATRLDSRCSARTRILVLTEGIFRSRIQADPELGGVSAVLFDEVHERSLDGDFGLALALDAQAAPVGRRKLVLATSIAETSLTLDGVRIVVDSGLARRPRYDRGAGMTRLVTERASQAAVTQRAGRAGRQGPGLVYRLWEEAATAALPRFDPAEILEADLSALVLDCALWGVPDPRSLRWLDPPPAAAVAEAKRRLLGLGAIGADGR